MGVIRDYGEKVETTRMHYIQDIGNAGLRS